MRENREFPLLFQSAHGPWVNEIERLWKQMHDAVAPRSQLSCDDILQHLMLNAEIGAHPDRLGVPVPDQASSQLGNNR